MAIKSPKKNPDPEDDLNYIASHAGGPLMHMHNGSHLS